MVLVASILLFAARLGNADALVSPRSLHLASASVTWSHSRASTRRYNFFKDMLSQAFDNDYNLSQEDVRKGMLEGPGDETNTSNSGRRELTATQEKWRQLNKQIPPLESTAIEANFYLTGIPSRDPSNDLFGSKVNISSRDRQVGLSVPKEPTVPGIRVEFLADEKCRCTGDSQFIVDGAFGDWKISEDGKQIRFRIEVTGYSRTIETKGTIQKIYWSNDDEKTTQTSTSYSIPSGWLYGEATLDVTARGEVQWNDGVLKVEQSMGLLGAASKMTPCGKFTASKVTDS